MEIFSWNPAGGARRTGPAAGAAGPGGAGVGNVPTDKKYRSEGWISDEPPKNFHPSSDEKKIGWMKKKRRWREKKQLGWKKVAKLWKIFG